MRGATAGRMRKGASGGGLFGGGRRLKRHHDFVDCTDAGVFNFPARNFLKRRIRNAGCHSQLSPVTLSGLKRCNHMRNV